MKENGDSNVEKREERANQINVRERQKARRREKRETEKPSTNSFERIRMITVS